MKIWSVYYLVFLEINFIGRYKEKHWLLLIEKSGEN
jgi:hypothetical protein